MSRKKSDGSRKESFQIWDRPGLKAKNAKQTEYINAIKNHTVVIGTGVAGSGKTFIAATIAADMLDDPRTHIEKIVIARPNEIEGTKSIGFLKGTLVEKMMPLVAPVANVIKARIGPSKFEYLLENGIIELLPLEHIKGLTFNNTFVIIDEAEDIEWSVLKTLLLRTGKNSKIIIDGDVRQTSISKTSGLQVLMDLAENYHLPAVHVDFSSWEEHCVRSDECRIFGQTFEAAKV
jgi:phosphate starvation-inducible PhoH-like protein